MGDVWLALRERLPAHLVESEWLEAVVAFYVENRTRLSPHLEFRVRLGVFRQRSSCDRGVCGA